MGNGIVMAYRKGTADEWVLQHSFENDIFFSAIPDYQPSPFDHILDVGAHMGDFTLLASTRVPHGRVIAVEASAATFRLLQANVAINAVRNVVQLHCALAGSSGRAHLHLLDGPHNWAYSTTFDFGEGSESVEAKSLEALFGENEVTDIDLAKFNCEGAEFEILLNAPSAVVRTMKRMLVLYHCHLVSGHSLEELIQYLQNCGFDTELKNERDDGDNGWIVARRNDM